MKNLYLIYFFIKMEFIKIWINKIKLNEEKISLDKTADSFITKETTKNK